MRIGLTRRSAVKALAGTGAVALLNNCSGFVQLDRAPKKNTLSGPSELIRRENDRPGTREWLLSKTRVEPASKYRCPWIEGFCSRTSVRAGQELEFYISTRPSSRVTVEIYRMGFYGGDGGRLVHRLGPLDCVPQPEPSVGPRRIRECRWTAAATMTIPENWVSGVYVGKLTEANEGLQSYVIFIVRDTRKADLTFQCSDTTWQAYNRWPDHYALYDDGREQWYWGPDVDVCFNRPYGKYCQILDAPLSTGSGEWFLWEFPVAFWLESKGYDVTYISNLDTNCDPRGLLRTKGFLSIGHDEYYSMEMFRNLQASVQQGLNVAFLSGNVCCGRIDPRPDSLGRLDRIFSRVDFYGPRDEAEIARFPSMGLLPHASPNSSELVGAGNIPPSTGGADWICAMPDHWLFEGTGMNRGEGIAGLVGWEWHGHPASIPGLEVLATGPTQDAPGKLNGGVYTATLYPGPKGNFVFNASTCWWGDGLAQPPGYVRPSVYTSPQGPDPRAQKITENLLARMVQAGPPLHRSRHG